MNLGWFYWIYTSRCIPCFWFIFPIANKSSRCNVELWCQRHQHWATDWLGMWLRSSPLRETSLNALNEIRSFEEWSHTAGEQQQSAKRVSSLQVSDMARRAQSVSFHPNNKWINNINPRSHTDLLATAPFCPCVTPWVPRCSSARHDISWESVWLCDVWLMSVTFNLFGSNLPMSACKESRAYLRYAFM